MTNKLNDLLAAIDLSTFSIQSFRNTDVADILIVAILIYYVTIWIKETRAWSVFRGIIIILSVRALSFVFELNTVSWIVDNTISVGLLAVVVIFQPELRKVLERLGKGRVAVSLFAESENIRYSVRTVNAIVHAVRAMAEARTGALIVLEDQVSLSEFEQTGIPIDALVSSQLLINIFENKTPLHDGAVIIRDNRIAAATCILPLTTDEIGKELGTRHRAAVGGSDVSDATVVVVSEETGSVSIARDGKLYRNLSDQKIREMLLKSGENEVKKLVLWKGRHTDEEDS